MKRIQILITAILLVTAFACRKDDGLPDIEEVPQRLLSEVAVEDDAAIKSYLETHFYNYEEFENPSLDFDFEVRFDTIAGDNADKIALITQVQTVVVNQASSDFGRVDDEEIDHNLYYLEVRQGSGESPTVGDRVVLQYEGTLLNGTKFDGRSTPLNQYLSGGLVRGYASGVEKLKGGEGPIENGDGTVSYENYGIGVIFMPSGLGYFSGPPNTLIPAYAPLVFKIDLFDFEADTDFDGDGIPSILEDVDGDGNLNNDNTDGESEPTGVYLANHNDTDDDNDGVPTINEIDKDAEGNFIGFIDADNDGIWAHLDEDETEEYE